MPFGLTNAPRTFQRAMNNLLAHLQFVRIYLDDILILGKSPNDHLENIKKILNIFRENKITINQKKCNFLTKEVQYLGVIIDS